MIPWLSSRTARLAGFAEMRRVSLTLGALTVRLPVLRTPDELARLERVWGARGYAVSSEIELVDPEAAS